MKRHEFQHEYGDYLVIWEKSRLLYRITMKTQAGKIPVKMKNIYFNKPSEAFLVIDEYLRHRKPKKRKVSTTKET